MAGHDCGLPEEAGDQDQVRGDQMKNFMIYMVGISGSGKTTIAQALEQEIRKRTQLRLQLIDGDTIRSEFGGVFGYTYEERMKCNQAVRVVAKYLIRNGISVILAQVAASEVMRQNVRRDFTDISDYIEIYVKCSVEECMRRDVKGYYKKLRSGEMENLNGANDVFEVPRHAEIVIDTEQVSVEEAVDSIMRYLEEKGYGV